MAALEEAILASLDVVGRLLRPPTPLDASSANQPASGGGGASERYAPSAPHAPCTLERMLLAGSADVGGGGVSPAAALASYVTYRFSPTIHRCAGPARSLAQHVHTPCSGPVAAGTHGKVAPGGVVEAPSPGTWAVSQTHSKWRRTCAVTDPTCTHAPTIHRAAMHALSLLCTTAASLLPRPVPLTACLAMPPPPSTTVSVV